jgi:hypothetical protein
MERARLLEDLFGRFGMGDIGPNETAVFGEAFAELEAVHPDHAPAIRSKVMYSRAADPASRAGNQDGLL